MGNINPPFKSSSPQLGQCIGRQQRALGRAQAFQPLCCAQGRFEAADTEARERRLDPVADARALVDQVLAFPWSRKIVGWSMANYLRFRGSQNWHWLDQVLKLLIFGTLLHGSTAGRSQPLAATFT
jgi:hypothetical protein